MKTLKQLIEEQIRRNTQADYRIFSRKQCVKCVRKWLQQKFTNDSEDEINWILKELLEELEEG